MNVLVLTSEPIDAAALRDALGGVVDPRDTQVFVVAPALQESSFKFWLSDADEAITKAEEVRRATLESLDDAGVSARADTGESDPMAAIGDAWRTFPADRIVVFTHPAGDEMYREDIDPDEIERRFGVPVDRAVVSAA